jgi:hypothetical protein
MKPYTLTCGKNLKNTGPFLDQNIQKTVANHHVPSFGKGLPIPHCVVSQLMALHISHHYQSCFDAQPLLNGKTYMGLQKMPMMEFPKIMVDQ